MTSDQVEELVRLLSRDDLTLVNDHRVLLGKALVKPRKITVIVRSVRDGNVIEQTEDVWLVGRESETEGYRIVMRNDGQQFGLASKGFPSDRFLCLDGWYGDLKSAFLAM